MKTPLPGLALGICVTLLMMSPSRDAALAADANRSLASLTIRETRGIEREHVAVSSGLPFARGRLKEVPPIIARTPSGEVMASQFGALAHWDDGSLKWGLVSVIVPEIKAQGRFTFDLVEAQSSDPPVEVAIHQLDRGFRVEDPEVSVTTNDSGLPESIVRQTAAGRIAFIGSKSKLLLQGRPVQSQQIRIDDLRVEEQGPVRTVLRTRGQLSLNEGASFAFLSRIIVYSNGQISTSYTVINQQVGRLHGFGVQVALADRFQTVQISGAAVRLPGTDGVTTPQNDDVGVRQTSAEAAVFLGKQPRNGAVRMRHQGGLRLIGESKHLELAIHDFWQRYPSELTANAARARMWFYPVDENNASRLYLPGRSARGEFTIRAVAGTPPEEAVAPIDHTDLHGFAGAEWYRDSGVLGKYSLSDFKLPGGTYNGHVEEHMGYLQRRKFIVNEFGFWDFGDGRGSADSAFRRNNEFGISYAMLFHYLRTGDRRFFIEGVAFAKHFRDVDTLHSGDMKGKSIRHTDNHVDGGSGYDTAHQWVEGMLLEYLLTGDRRSLEVAREMGVPLIAFAHDMHKRLTTKPNTLPTTERNLGWTLISLMFLEEVTGDRQYADAIKALVAGVVASQDQQRGHWPRSLPHKDFPTGGAPFMLGVLTEALMRYHEKTGDRAVARSIVKSSYWLSDEMWNPEAKNIRYKQWDRFWDSYNDGRTIPMVLPGMIYAEHLGRNDERFRQIIDDTLRVYARSCANLDQHGEGRNFKSMGMMSRSMPRFFYYFDQSRRTSR